MLNTHQSRNKLYFRGGSNTLKPNHITRYEYPCPLHYGIEALYIQPPINAAQRSRPQGRGDFGPNGAVFLTITRSTRQASTQADFEQQLASKTQHDESSSNALGKAMARVTKFQGNTLLQSGKFKKQQGFVYVIQRTTSIPLGGIGSGAFGKEEATYIIPCSQWRGLKPPSEPGHDSWWQRLHDLYNASYDRAYWSTRDTMDKYDIPAPIITWLPRPDVEAAITLHTTPPPGLDLETPECRLCFRDWYTDSEYACQLRCSHWLCLECVTRKIDEAGRGTLFPGETDPERKYWRCSACRCITPVSVDRADTIRRDEERYWRNKIARHRLAGMVLSWPVVLYAAEQDGWCARLPPDLDHDKADPGAIIQARVVRIRVADAVAVMESVPVFIAGLLDWGFSLDNPLYTAEADALKACLTSELGRLASAKRGFHTEELVAHLLGVGKAAFTPVVVQDAKGRLGNPVLPPGFGEYRDFLCEWTARGCFMGPTGRMEIVSFMEKMAREKKVGWWKDDRECWFDRGTPV